MGIRREIVQFWTGDNLITENRLDGVMGLAAKSGVPCRLLTMAEVRKELVSGVPLHPAFEYLSAVHRADYLRCYWAHHFGGGYADIKHYGGESNWPECFDYLDAHGEVDIVGTPELPRGCPIREYNEGEALGRLIILCYYVARPRSEFTTRWWERMNAKLDERYEALKEHPAKTPRDRGGESGYPLRWAEILGEIFHQVCYELYPKGRVSRMLKSGREWKDYK